MSIRVANRSVKVNKKSGLRGDMKMNTRERLRSRRLKEKGHKVKVSSRENQNSS